MQSAKHPGMVLPSSPSVLDSWRDSLDWKAIVMNKRCGLCKLIVRTLFQSPGFIEAVRGGQAAEIRIAARDVGKVIWRPMEKDNTDFTIGDLE